MPLYDFKCLTCDKIFESIESVGTKLAYCPICEKKSKQSVGVKTSEIGKGVSFRLKGFGWSKHGYDNASNRPSVGNLEP